MDIIVPVKQVPDLVEELEINSEGTDLDREYLTYIMNEFDEQALEQAVLLKEATGGTVTVIALGMGEADAALYTAAAKGADNLIKVTGDDFDETPPDSHAMAAIIAGVLDGRSYDLICTGVQAADDLDGQLGPLLASRLNVPHVSVVAGVVADGSDVVATQEYGGGVTATIKLATPAVLGIQAAPQTPRYAPISKVRQMQQERTIEEVEAPGVDTPRLKVRKMSAPESASHAEMITGSNDEIVERILTIIRDKGLARA
ncbi:MAG TPA: electron transfer flavoprotein subunit beta/FixA family protein [Actinomycetota bacterium]